MILIICLFLTTLVVGLVFIHWNMTRSRTYKVIEKNFKGPRTIPFLGNTHKFPINDSQGIFNLLMKYSKEYDKVYRLWVGPLPCIFTYDPEIAEAILSSPTEITKSGVYRFAVPWIGYGLVISSGAKWKSRRKILTPTFHFKILEDFVNVFEANGKILVEQLRQKVNQPSFDVYPFIKLYALDNICETAMGSKINAQKNSKSTYVTAVKNMCQVVNLRMYQPWLMPELLFSMSELSKVQRDALTVLHSHTRETITLRRNQIRQSEHQPKSINKSEEDLNMKKRTAFLDLLLESAEGSGLSDDDIQEEVDTFMFEGHDTVTSGISFTLYELSKNPHVQEKVYEELVSMFGNSDRAATSKDYNEMKYLDRVLKEVLRFYPSVPIVGRHLGNDLPLRDGRVVPAGTQVVIMFAALQMNPAIWPEPHKFDPDRFLQENTSKRNTYAHVPFSAGPRNCIGQRYAILEMKASVSKILRSYELLPCDKHDEPRLSAELVLISSNGIKIRLQERK